MKKKRELVSRKGMQQETARIGRHLKVSMENSINYIKAVLLNSANNEGDSPNWPSLVTNDPSTDTGLYPIDLLMKGVP